jgi:aminoglycoside 3-N-acetyltransferase
MTSTLSNRVPPAASLKKTLKNKVRAIYRKSRRATVRAFFSYEPAELVRALRALGIRNGDSVMFHSAFEEHHGFRGSIETLIDTVLEAVGPAGNLLMVSLPYRSSALDYLTNLKQFDVRKTPSAMGLVSEFFRRRRGVLRSVHPSHPVLACGPRAAWFVEGHETCASPCGPGTPFAKLREVGGKVAFFNVSFAYFTFFHHLEHVVQPHLPFQLYHDPPFEVQVIDRDGKRISVRTLAFSRETLRRRRFQVLETWLWKHGVIRKGRVGASSLLLVELDHVINAVEDMTRQGIFFYDLNC